MLALDRVKLHVRIDGDTGEDDLLTAYTEAAWEAVSNFVDRPLYATAEDLAAEPEPSPHAMVVTRGLEHAMLLLIGYWYAHREAVGVGAGAAAAEMPMAARFLMLPYRRFKVGNEPALS